MSVVLQAPTPHALPERDLVRAVTDRVAALLADAIERDALSGDGEAPGGRSLHDDRRRQQLLVGQWLTDEVARINRARLAAGSPPLSGAEDGELRRRVAAELTGAGPLQPYLG